MFTGLKLDLESTNGARDPAREGTPPNVTQAYRWAPSLPTLSPRIFHEIPHRSPPAPVILAPHSPRPNTVNARLRLFLDRFEPTRRVC
jgi:hypothetical protein